MWYSWSCSTWMFVFCVHCVYPLRLVIAMSHLSYQHHLSIILIRLPSYCQCPSLTVKSFSHCWATSSDSLMHELKAVNVSSSTWCATGCAMLTSTVVCQESLSLCSLLNLPTTTAACSCACVSLEVTYCLYVDLLCGPVNMWQLFVVVCMPFDITIGKAWKTTAWSFLASSCSKQNSLCLIIQPLMCSWKYALLVLYPFDVSTGRLCQQSIHFIVVMLVLTPPLFPLSHL